MRAVAVVALTVVLHDELPVALFDEVDLVGDLRVLQVVVGEVRLDDADDFLEVRRRLLGGADEDEPADGADVERLEPELSAVERRRLGVGEGEAAVGAVGPLVVGADQVADGPARLLQQARAAVAAHIVEGLHLLVVVPEDDHGDGAEVDRDEVARIGDLGFGRTEEPVLGEDGLDVEIEHFLAGVEGRFEAEAV